VVREYMVKIRGDLTRPEYDKLMAGTSIEGHLVKPRLAQREKQGRGGATTWWRIEVTEGRTHEVRELFFRAGHHVQRLRRTAIGPLRDDTLKPGEFRTVSEYELQILQRVTSSDNRPRRARPGGSDTPFPTGRKPRKPKTSRGKR
jgi:16S rRNA U516 pseudouridylate synthase RsuA-like enzyme